MVIASISAPTTLSIDVNSKLFVGERFRGLRSPSANPEPKRRMTTLAPGPTDGWGVHSNNYDNLYRAFTERMLTIDGKLAIQPTVDVRRYLAKFAGLFSHHCPTVDKISTNSFVDHYKGHKRARYEAAVRSLSLSPLVPQDASVQMFVKDEKTNFRANPDKCARAIFPRTARYGVELGCYIKPFETACFAAISGVFRGVTVAKCLNCFQRGALLRQHWEEFMHPVAIELDATRFDAHCNSQLMQWQYSMTERVFPPSQREYLRYLNTLRTTNICYGRTHDGHIKASIHGRKMSGDMDTSCGNCLIMCAVTYTAVSKIGVGKFRYINDGDDGVLIVERNDLPVLESFLVREYAKVGLPMKWAKTTDIFEQIEFCQTRPVFDGKRWRMCRVPFIAMAKDSLTLNRVKDNAALDHYRNANGWCGAALAGDLPIYCSFYKTMTNSEQVKFEFTEGKHYLANGIEPRFADPTPESRISFFNAFGLSPETQIVIENFYKTLQLHNGPFTPAEILTHEQTLEILLQ